MSRSVIALLIALALIRCSERPDDVATATASETATATATATTAATQTTATTPPPTSPEENFNVGMRAKQKADQLKREADKKVQEANEALEP